MAAVPLNPVTGATPRVGLPQMHTETFPSQIFWLVVTFGLLFLVLWRITLPMIERVIGERRNRIEGDLGTAEKLRQQASTALESYEAALTSARSRSHQILDENRKSLAGELDQLRAHADADAQAAMQQAEQRVSADRDRALGALRPAAAEAAAAIVERLIGAKVSADEAANAVAEQQAPA